MSGFNLDKPIAALDRLAIFKKEALKMNELFFLRRLSQTLMQVALCNSTEEFPNIPDLCSTLSKHSEFSSIKKSIET